MRPPAPWLLALLLAVPVLVAAPSAEAQAGVVPTSLQVTLVDAGDDLVPSRPTSIEVKVRYRWNPGALVSPQAPTEVYLGVVEAPEWTAAVVDPVLLRFQVPPAQMATGGALERSAVVNLTLKDDAPAFVKQNLTVRAEAKANGNLAGSEAASPPLPLKAAYVGRLAIEAPEVVRTRGGVTTTVEFLVRNVGNGPTDVRWRIPLKPEESRLDTEPGDLTLAPGEERVVSVTLRTPWTTSARGQLVIEGTPVFSGGEAEGAPASATIEIEGVSAVPGPGLGTLLAAAALAASRRRTR